MFGASLITIEFEFLITGWVRCYRIKPLSQMICVAIHIVPLNTMNTLKKMLDKANGLSVLGICQRQSVSLALAFSGSVLN